MNGKYVHAQLNKEIPDDDHERIKLAVGLMKVAEFMNNASESGGWPDDAPSVLKETPIDYAEPMTHVFMSQAERLTHEYDEDEYNCMGDLLEDWEKKIALQYRKQFM